MRFQTYKDRGGKWRWRVVGDNNRIVGASSQGFSSKYRCRKNAEMLLRGLILRNPMRTPPENWARKLKQLLESGDGRQ